MRKFIWVACVTLCWLLPMNSFAADLTYPPKWPWKGVSISFPEGDVSILEKFKERLPLNVVRLNVNIRRYADLNHVSGKEALKASLNWTDIMLLACKRLGIAAVIEVNHFPLDSGNQYKMSEARFWNDKNSLDEVVAVAETFATKFHDRQDELVAYQFVSEPLVISHEGRPSSPVQWPQLLNRILTTVRDIDTQHWIIVNPGPGGEAQGYADFTPPLSFPRLVFCAHVYVPYLFTLQGTRNFPVGGSYPGMFGLKYWNKNSLRGALKPLRIFQNKYHVPVYIGEFSAVRWAEGGERYIIDLASLYNEYGWGWSYFSATGWHGFNPDYNKKFSDDNPKNWKNDFVGVESARWSTLDIIFK